MTFRSLTQTRWKIEPDRVTLFPNGFSYVLSVILAIALAGILLIFSRYMNESIGGSLPLVLLLLFVVVLFWAHGNTYVVFDGQLQRMQKKLMGLIPVTTVPFHDLQGIQVVTSLLYGGYNYRAFTKANRYGKGTTVSSGYSRADDPNALALIHSVLPAIYKLMNTHEDLSAAATPPEPITQYRYFTGHPGNYTLKKNKPAGILIGLALLGLGIYMMIDSPFFADLDSFRRGIILLFLLVCGPAIILAVFTRIVFDPQRQTVSRISPVGLGNRQYQFSEFTGFQTIRRSINFIYSGTDVHMYFAPAGQSKEVALVLRSFRNPHKIDRFVAEVQQIMQVPVRPLL